MSFSGPDVPMTYLHKGKILDNGVVSTGEQPVESPEFTVFPEDDGLHVAEYNKGDFEWWYFDVTDRVSGIFLKIVMHIGTDPLKTRVFPQLAISVTVPGKSQHIVRPYAISDLTADTDQCHIAIGKELMIRQDPGKYPAFHIRIELPRFRGNFKFSGTIEGWKPLGREIHYGIGIREASFSWVIPAPRARVEGEFDIDHMHFSICNGIGYHDHNYLRVNRRHPLHLDELVRKWYWGKCYAGDLTVIFMDTHTRSQSLRSLMVAENNAIVYSANNLIDCDITSYGFDRSLKVKYPETLRLSSTDKEFPFQAVFDFNKILDHKDLLEEVNPVARFLIRMLLTRPAYHGISASVRMRKENVEVTGYGNFESMIFRN
jgi:hypothetical protein